MTTVVWTVVGLSLLAAALWLGAQGGMLRGHAPKNLGVLEGRLKPPSKTPNSVSSQADLWPDHPQREYARIAPLALAGDASATMARLKSITESRPQAVVIEARSDYLYAQFSSRWLKFTDDVEFWADPSAGNIQVRSSSRLGRKDFGVNRARIEALRRALAGPN